MVAVHTLEATFKEMECRAKRLDTSDPDTALRTIAEETAIVSILEQLNEQDNTPTNLREQGIQTLLNAFEEEYPDFDPDAEVQNKLGARTKSNPEEAWEKLKKDAQGPGAWKNEYDDGLGPGVFTLECNAKKRDEICNYLDQKFPVPTELLHYSVSASRRGRTQVIVRVDETCDVTQFSDHRQIKCLREIHPDNPE